MNGWNIPWTKMVDFESLGALLGPGAPDPNLTRFVLNSMFRTTHKVFKFFMFFDRMIKKYRNHLGFSIAHRSGARKVFKFLMFCWSDVQKVLTFLMFLTLTFPWPRSELTIQAPNEFGLDLKVPWAQLLVRKRFIRVAEEWGGACWTLDALGQHGRHFLKNHPSHKRGSRHWSVVSCVRCGCVGAGLGFPVGASAPLLLTPPTSD